MYDLSGVEFTDGMAIWCNTEEKANALFLELHKRGFRWGSGASLETGTNFLIYGEKTGYRLVEKEKVFFGEGLSGVQFEDLPNLQIIDDQTAKADNGKLEISMCPTQIIRDITEVRMYGNRKYGSPDNWKQVEKERYINALLRHTLAFIDNTYGIDEESGLPHYKHMACNMAFICEMMRGDFDEPKQGTPESTSPESSL